MLVLHGWRDPMAPPEQVITFADEMQALGADWELIAYGEALHAFTNPNAQDPDNGLCSTTRRPTAVHGRRCACSWTRFWFSPGPVLSTFF